MKRILLRGPCLSVSGYGVHCRQLARYLFARERSLGFETSCQVLPWGHTPWMLDENDADGLVGEVMKRTREPGSTKFDVTIQVQLPNEWDRSLGTKNVGVTAGVETDRCASEWVAACNGMDLVIVPSEHTARTLKASGNLERPLFVVPESFPDALVAPADQLPELNLQMATKFNFLIIGQLTGGDESVERKGTLSALRWLCEEFAGDPSIGIFVKTNIGRNSITDRHNTEQLITSIVSTSRKSFKFPHVTLLHGKMSDIEMASLYRQPKMGALVCPTRGEGFGLPILEAAVCGLPVISTAWSAHTETLSAGRTIGIEYTLAEVPSSKVDGRIFVKGARWAQPDEVDFKRKVRKISTSSSIPREWARDLSEKLRASHSASAIESKWDDVLQEILT